MPNNRWLYSFAPVTTITIAAIFAVSLTVVSTMLAMSGPWLGIVFDHGYSGAGVRIEQVVEHGPAAGKLNPGDIIRSVETNLHGSVAILPSAVMEDPHYLSSYAEYNNFIDLQQRIWEVISSSSFTVILDDGRKIELSPAEFPGPGALPAALWWILLFGGASFLLGVTVWSLRRNDPVTRVLAISGMGFMLGAYACVIYVTREFAMPARDYFVLVSASHLGFVAFVYASILTFWYYPKRLGNGIAAGLIVVYGVAIWLNEVLQWWTWPAHPFYAHFVVAYVILIVFTTMQWRKSRGALLERAMLKWMLGTMSITLGFNIALFCIPIILSGKPVTSTVLTFGSIFVFYLGLVFGIIRYRQFDMGNWWLKAWQWLLFILVAVTSDAVFVYFLHLNNAVSGGLAIGIGSIYLLARQWYWGRFSGSRNRALDRALPHLVDALILQHKKFTPDQQWQQLIERVFNPLSLKIITDKCDAINIAQSGMALQLPNLDGVTTIEVFCCDQGKRLFISNDVKLARQLLELMRHSRDVIAAHEQGAQEERHRIQRDLHDDVAARLLSLLHQTREPMISRVASNALRGLRDVIHLLGAEEAALEDVMSDIEAGAREQLSGLGVRFEWHAPDKWPNAMLSSQQHINLRRIARETIANALKHAHPAGIIMQVKLEGDELSLRIQNDGTDSHPSGWVPGRGLNNIKSRVAEVGGSHEWGIEHDADNKRYCYLAVRIPFSPSEKPETHTTD